MSPLFFTLITALGGSWMLHPSFYPQVDRIIDTERYAYIHAHQEIFDRKGSTWGINHATVFRYDRLNPQEGIIALPTIQQGMPATVRVATYSPAIRSLVTAGENGEIWITPDDATPFPIYGLDNLKIRGENLINSLTLTPSGNLIWAAASYGFAAIDPDTRTVSQPIYTDFPIDWIAPVGENLVAFANSTAYEISCKKGGETNLTPLNIDNPMSLMPLTDNTFAFFSTRPEGLRGYALNIATRNNGEWETFMVLNEEITYLEDRYSITHRTYKNAIPNKEGYYIYSENDAFQLLTGIDPDLTADDPAADFKAKAIRSTRKVADSWRPSGSWDLSQFTFYRNWSGFYTRSVSNGNWSEPGDFLLPEAPNTFMPSSMTWHPGYGLLLGGHGTDQLGSAYNGTSPMWINALDADGWKDFSPSLHPADVIASNSSFSDRRRSFPISSPKGLAFDPNDPDHVYAGSTTGGWARASLSNPEEIPLHAGNPNDPCKTFAGFVEAYPVMTAWSLLCNFSAPSFDNEGRMWMLYNNTNRSGNGDYAAELHYYTKDDLQAIRDANLNPEQFIPTRILPVTLKSPLSNAQLALALTHPANSNLIALASGGFGQPLYILDHNGTPDDPTDDHVAILDQLTDPTGGKVTKDYIYKLYENPLTGDLWVGTYNGVIVVRPAEAFSHPTSVYRPGAMHHDERAPLRNLQSVGVNAITTDSQGRIWIGTYDKGIVVLSPDGNEIVGEFTASGSGLPDNRIYNIAFHPTRKSLVISTFEGIAEFFPSDSGGNPERGVTVSPAIVSPSHMGYITICGLMPGTEIDIITSGGETVACMTAGNSGKVQWDGLHSGRRVPSGIYTVRCHTDGKSLATIRILN